MRKFGATRGVSALALATVFGGALFIGQGSANAATSTATLEAQIQQLQAQLQQLQARQDFSQAQASQAQAAAAAAAKSSEVPAGSTIVTYSQKGGLKLGALTLKPGGYFELGTVWRAKNQAADFSGGGAAYNTIPLPTNPASYNGNAHEREFRGSVRATRLSLLVTAKPTTVATMSAFIDADFLGAATTASAGSPEAYTPRLRQAWLGYERSDWGFHLFAGQTFSLENSYKVGMLPNNESGLLVIDQSNIPGYSTVRHPAIRLVKDLSPVFSAGVSIENPQTTYGAIGAANTIANGGTNLNTAPASSTLTGVASNGGTVTLENIPDVVAKVAADTSFGHYEVSGVARFLHGYSAFTGAQSSHTQLGGGVHLGAFASLIPGKAEVRFEGLAGYGVAHYDSAGLSDAVITNNGRIQPVPFLSSSLGLYYHFIPTNDLYTNVGYAQQDHTQGGFGTYASSPAACMVTNSATACSATSSDVHRVWSTTLGTWQRFYQGPAGTMFAGAMVDFYRNDYFKYSTAGGSLTPHATTEKVEFSIRYSPFQ